MACSPDEEPLSRECVTPPTSRGKVSANTACRGRLMGPLFARGRPLLFVTLPRRPLRAATTAPPISSAIGGRRTASRKKPSFEVSEIVKDTAAELQIRGAASTDSQLIECALRESQKTRSFGDWQLGFRSRY